MLEHDSVASYLHYIILYVNKGKVFWGVSISNVTSVGEVHFCLVLNCFLFFGVYCAKHWTTSSLSKYKKETCFGNLKWITSLVVRRML